MFELVIGTCAVIVTFVFLGLATKLLKVLELAHRVLASQDPETRAAIRKLKHGQRRLKRQHDKLEFVREAFAENEDEANAEHAD